MNSSPVAKLIWLSARTVMLKARATSAYTLPMASPVAACWIASNISRIPPCFLRAWRRVQLEGQTVSGFPFLICSTIPPSPSSPLGVPVLRPVTPG